VDATQTLRDVILRPRADAAPGWLEPARPGGRALTRQGAAALVRAWCASAAVAPGRRLGLLARDPVDLAALFVGVIAAGGVAVPLDPRTPAAASADLLARAGAEAVVTTVADAPDLGLPAVPLDADLRPTEGTGARPGGGPGGGVLLFSSGSTGPRKAVLLREAQLLHVARAVAGHHALTPDDRGYNPLPLFHVNAEVVAVLGSLVSGGTLVLDDRFHRRGFADLVRDRRITWVNAVPAILSILAADRPARPLPASVRFVRSASAPLPVSVLERFEAGYGVQVLETYGMTEAASQITANPLDGGRRVGSVGVPVGVDLRVVGGRVQIRGDGVIRAYADGAGAERFGADGWLDTGDLGRLDADGYLHLVGRDGDAINRGGEKVFPHAVEEVLRRHPGVRDAVVVGRADRVLGQVPVAHVVPEPPQDADRPERAGRLAAELRELAARGLERSHVPVAVLVRAGLPAGPTGKVSRAAVAASEAGAETAAGAGAEAGADARTAVAGPAGSR